MMQTFIRMVFLNCLFFLATANLLKAQDVSLNTGNTQIVIDQNGNYSSILVNEQEILQSGKFPFLIAGEQTRLVLPTSLKKNKDILEFTMEDGKKIQLKTKESDVCVTIEVAEIPNQYDVLFFGPLGVTINDVVGDVIGVAQGKDIAFGIQGLNIKTNPGIPMEYVEVIKKQFNNYEGEQAHLSVASIPDYRLAATKTADGTLFQFFCRKRSEVDYRPFQQIDRSLVLPVEGEDAHIKGMKVALFGCDRAEALNRIGAIEVEQGLPHPMFNGEWAKTARSAMGSYLISNFSEDEIDWVLDKAEIAGFELIYHSDPFVDWGHFNWNPSFTKNGDKGVKELVNKAKKRGIGVGVHTLSNFMTTKDPYVSPIPSKHLLKQGSLVLLEDLNPNQTDVKIKKSALFAMPMTLNAMQIEDELITFGNVKENGDEMLLENCVRGAFGTTAAAHKKKEALYKLWDYPYKTLFPDLTLQDEFSGRLAEVFNKTGLEMISFDGLEGCTYTGHDEYATNRFVQHFYDGIGQRPVFNDASRLSHYLWHIHTRMNWGEPWGEAMRTGQVENRIKNQNFFERNLFPRMLGWFLIRLAEKNFECSTLEDLEWALAESAGFDAGYAMTINTRTLKNHGQIDQLLGAINNWDKLRKNQSFTEEQKARLKDPATEWHLEKLDEQNYNLYPLYISKHFRCNLSEMQPGQPGGSDWSWSTPYVGEYMIRLKVEGDGTIQDPTFNAQGNVIKFPCEISRDQYLLYSFDGKAYVTDKNYNILQEVKPQGQAKLAQESSAVAFSCELLTEDAPEVVVRYMTKGDPELIKMK